MNEKVVEVDKDALKMALKGLARVGGQGSGAAKGQRSCGSIILLIRTY
jgi:hypothetical protein